MDKREALKEGYQLHFPGMVCTVETETGRGSNAIVYKGWYADALDHRQKHHVLIKELFPYHEKGRIYRDLETGMICFAEEARQTMQIHTESFKWGNEIHLNLRSSYPDETGVNINTYSYHNTYYTILDFSGGRTLEQDLSFPKEKLTLRRIVQRCIGILESLKLFHEMGYLHLDVSPDNVLLMNHGRKERVELIDYNSVLRMDGLQMDDSLRFSTKQGFSSPEIRKRDIRSVGPWTDLYSITAVFYFCLMGCPLSRMQLCGLMPVQVNESLYLKDVPETVKSLIRSILARGLAVVCKKRYQSVQEMLTDFQELLDRIDGIGITHWSLWEMGRKSINREIQTNPALSYLTDESSLYPMEITSPGNIGMAEFLHGCGNVILTGSGGAGKTTLLLRTAWLESRRYRPDRAAVLYIPLYDYYEGNDTFIHDKILQKMRFHRETESYADARHSLNLLLQKPLQTRMGECPIVCLLLDGYNEISGNTQALQNEIEQLAQMDGVSIFITSRSSLSEYTFENWSLELLSEETIAQVLGQHGLLIPEHDQMRALLSNAMMLNLFVSTCLNSGEQILPETKEDLIEAYLNAILFKEIHTLPEGDPQRWQFEAAVKCVFPVVASLESRKSLSNEVLLKHMDAIYRNLGKRIIYKKYPEWLGRASSIRGNAQKGEEWYGLMLHDILWRRLGLLVRDEDGTYRVFHQEFREVLSEQGNQILSALQRKKSIQYTAAASVAAAVLAVTGSLIYAKKEIPPYDTKKAIEMIDYAGMASNALNRELTLMQNLLRNDDSKQDMFDRETYETFYGFERTRKELEKLIYLIAIDTNEDGNVVSEYLAKLDSLLNTGERLPWNERVFDGETLIDEVELIALYQERYLEYLDVLEKVYNQEPEAYESCRTLIGNVLETDAAVFAAYYKIVYEMQIEGMGQWELSSNNADSERTLKRQMENVTLCPEIMEYSERWKDTDMDDMRKYLAEALDQNLAERRKLSGNETYIRYLHFY